MYLCDCKRSQITAFYKGSSAWGDSLFATENSVFPIVKKWETFLNDMKLTYSHSILIMVEWK